LAEALVIAVLGAARTGKRTLAAALARRLAEETGLRCTWVSERARVDAAMAAHDIVVCDMAMPMKTVAWHRAHVALTLLTAIDLPGMADEAERADAALRELLRAEALPWVLVSGRGEARVEAALDAATPLLRRRGTPRAGLLTRLARRNAAAPRWDWVCDKCDVPECEHAQRRSGRG